MSKPWPPSGYTRKATPEAILQLEEMVEKLTSIMFALNDERKLYRRRAVAMLAAVRKERANRRAWVQIAEKFAARLNEMEDERLERVQSKERNDV